MWIILMIDLHTSFFLSELYKTIKYTTIYTIMLNTWDTFYLLLKIEYISNSRQQTTLLTICLEDHVP